MSVLLLSKFAQSRAATAASQCDTDPILSLHLHCLSQGRKEARPPKMLLGRGRYGCFPKGPSVCSDVTSCCFVLYRISDFVIFSLIYKLKYFPEISGYDNLSPAFPGETLVISCCFVRYRRLTPKTQGTSRCRSDDSRACYLLKWNKKMARWSSKKKRTVGQ
jgi:hypothetical protein